MVRVRRTVEERRLPELGVREWGGGRMLVCGCVVVESEQKFWPCTRAQTAVKLC